MSAQFTKVVHIAAALLQGLSMAALGVAAMPGMSMPRLVHVAGVVGTTAGFVSRSLFAAMNQPQPPKETK